MFKSQLKAAQERAQLLASLISAAGFDPEELAKANDENALKTALESAQPTAADSDATERAAQEKLLTAAGIELAEDQSPEDALAAAIGEPEAASAEAEVFKEGLKGAGVELPQAGPDGGLTAKGVRSAISAKIKTDAEERATERMAEVGFPASDVPAAGSDDQPGGEGGEALSGFDRLSAAISADFAGEPGDN